MKPIAIHTPTKEAWNHVTEFYELKWNYGNHQEVIYPHSIRGLGGIGTYSDKLSLVDE